MTTDQITPVETPADTHKVDAELGLIEFGVALIDATKTGRKIVEATLRLDVNRAARAAQLRKGTSMSDVRRATKGLRQRSIDPTVQLRQAAPEFEVDVERLGVQILNLQLDGVVANDLDIAQQFDRDDINALDMARLSAAATAVESVLGLGHLPASTELSKFRETFRYRNAVAATMVAQVIQGEDSALLKGDISSRVTAGLVEPFINAAAAELGPWAIPARVDRAALAQEAVGQMFDLGKVNDVLTAIQRPPADQGVAL